MIFDKKVNGFRIVPITKHIAFEKQKIIIPKQSAPKQAIATKPPVNGQGLIVLGARTGPKASANSFIKNLKAKIKTHNTSFVGGQKLEITKPAKKGKNKAKASDEESVVYGGDDANEEYEEQAHDQFNDDSHEEVAEDIILGESSLKDLEESDNAEEESLFDEDGNLKVK